MVAAPYENDHNYVNKWIYTVHTIDTIDSSRHIRLMFE
jgi:hypothetical protein